MSDEVDAQPSKGEKVSSRSRIVAAFDEQGGLGQAGREGGNSQAETTTGIKLVAVGARRAPCCDRNTRSATTKKAIAFLILLMLVRHNFSPVTVAASQCPYLSPVVWALYE